MTTEISPEPEATIAGELTISEPGVYAGVSDIDYHADPVPGGSLSCSGAKKLLSPSTPALFKYEQEHPPESTKAFDEGKAAHRLVLGVGPELVLIPFDEWRTNEAKAAVKEAQDRGAIPLKPKQWQMVHDMAEALQAHPTAAALLDPERGLPEQSLFWTDPDTGVTLRARLDWLPDPTPGGRMILADYKTARSAHPEQFARAAADYGYHQQDPWYSEGVRALGLTEDLAFVFIVQEKTPPYLVSVCQLVDDDRRLGHVLNHQAIRIYAECKRTGNWPGYPDVTVVELPGWYRARNGV
jgi:hypothetical protein